MPDEVRIENVGELLGDLRAIAHVLLRQESGAASVRPTALVLTALRRSKRLDQDWSELVWANREHFFRSVYAVMRRALTDHARRRRAEKRPPDCRRVDPAEIDLNDLPGLSERQPERLAALEEALEWLESEDDQAAQVVQHHYFAGASVPEIAKLTELSERTVKRQLARGRLLLHHKIVELLGREPAFRG